MSLPKLAEIRKAYAAFAAGVVVMLAAGLITGEPAAWLAGAIQAVTAGLATYGVGPDPAP